MITETREGAPTTLTLELLGLARAVGDPVVALVFSSAGGVADALVAHGADVVQLRTGADDEYDERWLVESEAEARELGPCAVLVGHTPGGSDLAPRLAARLETAVVTGCVTVDAEGDRILFTRAAFGGNVRETVSITTTPAIATVKAGVGTAREDVTRTGEVVHREVQSGVRRTRVVSRERASETQRLEDAKVIVAGGRGLEGPEGFRVLEDLAAATGAAVGSSRVPCDLGWCPPSWQIGLTGKTVTPDLYFAVGISGAGHHMAGCGNAKTIVAINTDRDAAIFREARFGIVGDYRKVIPALIAALKEA